MSEAGAARVACVGDLHGRIDRLERVARHLERLEPHVVLLTGDFGAGRSGGRAPHEAAIATLEPLGVPTLFVPGNHDRRSLEHPGNVDGRVRRVAGLRIWGLGGSPLTPARLPYEWTDEQLDGLAPPPCDLVLSHAPPRDTALDRMHDGRHVGSRVVRRIAEEGPAGALVCGHIHEAGGAELVGGCLCYNAGSLGAFAGRPQVGVLHRAAGAPRWSAVHHDLDAGTSRPLVPGA